MVEFHRKISYMQLICGFLTKCPKRNFSVFDVISEKNCDVFDVTLYSTNTVRDVKSRGIPKV